MIKHQVSNVCMLMAVLLIAVAAVVAVPAITTRASDAVACAKPAAPGKTSEKVVSDDLERTFRQYVPATYRGTAPTALVLSLHGFAGNPDQQALWSQWDKVADAEGFIIAYPGGTGLPARWYAGTNSFTGRELVDDVKFLNSLIDTLVKRFCIDESRIFVTGLSNGGGMTHRVACELSARIAAIGTVAGAYPALDTPCNPTRPVPVIAFHGDADPVVDYAGVPRLMLPAPLDWAASWAKRNGCKTGPEHFAKNEGSDAVKWADCAGNGDVQFYQIIGGGHTWPGGITDVPAFAVGKTSDAINASRTMWAFFVAHPLPPMP